VPLICAFLALLYLPLQEARDNASHRFMPVKDVPVFKITAAGGRPWQQQQQQRWLVKLHLW